MINQDVMTLTTELQQMVVVLKDNLKPQITPVSSIESLYRNFYSWYETEDEDHHFDEDGNHEETNHPMSTIFYPVRSEFTSDKVVGVVSGSIAWDNSFTT